MTDLLFVVAGHVALAANVLQLMSGWKRLRFVWSNGMVNVFRLIVKNSGKDWKEPAGNGKSATPKFQL
jgi:hypothetical protein